MYSKLKFSRPKIKIYKFHKWLVYLNTLFDNGLFIVYSTYVRTRIITPANFKHDLIPSK